MDVDDRGNKNDPNESRDVDRINDNRSLRSHNTKNRSQQRNVTPSYVSSPGNSANRSPNENQVAGKNNVASSAPADLSKSTRHHPHDRRLLFSGQKNVQTGPLKKRSPKPSLVVSAQDHLCAPISTPANGTIPQNLRISRTSASGYSSLSSLSSTSHNFRRNLTSSAIGPRGREALYQLPVGPNLNRELLEEAIIATPDTISSNGGNAPLSNGSLPFWSQRHSQSSTPLTFSFSKKRKRPNTMGTIITQSGSASDLISPKPPDNVASRGPKSSLASDDSVAYDILRFTHPFGNYPSASIKRDSQKPISSPLLRVPAKLSGDNSNSNAHRAKEATTVKVAIKEEGSSKPKISLNLNALFSPLSTTRNISFDTKTPATFSQPKPNLKENTVKDKLHANPIRFNKRSLTITHADIFKGVRTTFQPCKCKKTKCLKLYCECFHKNVFCNPDLCRCENCLNTEAHNSYEEPKGRRVLAMLNILTKRPDAFSGRGRKSNTRGCSCKKSRYVYLFMS